MRPGRSAQPAPRISRSAPGSRVPRVTAANRPRSITTVPSSMTSRTPFMVTIVGPTIATLVVIGRLDRSRVSRRPPCPPGASGPGGRGTGPGAIRRRGPRSEKPPDVVLLAAERVQLQEEERMEVIARQVVAGRHHGIGLHHEDV